MGRNINIYGINHQQVRKSFPADHLVNENPDCLTGKMYELDYADAERFVRRVMQDTENLSPAELSCLELFYSDPVLRKMIRRSGGPGMVLVFNIPSTNASCVFMEQFLGFASRHDLPRGDAMYVLSKREVEEFLCWMAELTFVFSCGEKHELQKFYKKSQFKEKLSELLREEEKRREELNEKYSEKWGTDYFAFSTYHGAFVQLMKSTNEYDRFLVADSF